MRLIVMRSAGPWLVVLTLVAAGTAAAVGYALTAPKHYRATAELLVSPVSTNDPTFTGLDVLRDTAGGHTAAASAAALLRSPQVADAVRADLGLARSRDSLLGALDGHVVDSSNVVAVTVEDTSAAGAAQLANAFADALVKQRTTGFQSQLAATIRRDQQLLQGLSRAARSGGAGADLEKRLTALEGFQGQPDPTIRHGGQASAPESASWPKLPRLAAIGALAGLAAGLLVALVLALGRLGRNRGAGGAASFDRGVPERLVERLEQRVTERIAALEAERERLSAREAGLAARERDVAARIAELRAAVEAAPAPSDAPVAHASVAHAPDRDEEAARALTAREEALQVRVAQLTKREIGLARRAAAIAREEQETRGRAESLARREAELDERLEAAARAPEPQPEPERGPKRQPEREAAPGPVLAPVALPQPVAPAPRPPAVPALMGEGQSGAWNLLALERLVNDRGDEFPDRRDEWSSYLYFLREYAAPDGTVPSSFDGLIQETFSELVA
jgi:capsular polysaccharide biosynthesis protein